MSDVALFPDLPEHLAPPWAYVNLYELVPHLLDLYPAWGPDDVVEFVEEKTRAALHDEDRLTVAAIHLRCQPRARVY